MVQVFNQTAKFIRKLYNEPFAQIPLHAPLFIGNEKIYIEDCIDSTFVSSVGKFVGQFEYKIAEYTGANNAIACVNGTSALHLALKMVGVERNTEVITQSLTFVATANAIKYCDAYPVFLDVDLDTLGLSPISLKSWIENNTKWGTRNGELINIETGRRISACVPMHTFGHPCRIDEIVDICNNYNIPVVEDAAESLGSWYKQKHTGTFGDIGVLSFNGNKIITTGGGGMLLFKNNELAKVAKHLSTQAKIYHPWEFIHDQIGYNYRMPNINAALGVAQLEQLENYIHIKREIAELYKNFFENLSISFFIEPQDAYSNYWLNLILLNSRKERDNFLKYLNENKIMSRPIWRLMNNLEFFRDCQTGELSNSKWLEDRVINLPSSVIK